MRRRRGYTVTAADRDHAEHHIPALVVRLLGRGWAHKRSPVYQMRMRMKCLMNGKRGDPDCKRPRWTRNC